MDPTRRALGTLGMVASPALLVVWLAGGFDNPEPPRAIVALQLLFLVGWMSSVAGLHRLRAAGVGKARMLLPLQLLGVSSR